MRAGDVLLEALCPPKQPRKELKCNQRESVPDLLLQCDRFVLQGIVLIGLPL